MQRWRPAMAGVAVWLAGGGTVGALLALTVGWSNGLAIAGGALSVGAAGWAVGPFKSPMVWSEGALASYQGNAESQLPLSGSRRRFVTVPAVALLAGLLLLILAIAVAAA